jgi:hypothetical protein
MAFLPSFVFPACPYRAVFFTLVSAFRRQMGVVSSPPAFLQLFKMAAGVVGVAVPVDVAAAFKGKSFYS